MKTRTHLFLDSGAFTAAESGIEIDCKTYIQFIIRNQRLLHSYVSLDKIPGTGGLPLIPEVFEDAARTSYQNLRQMLSAGLDPIAVIHEGERMVWLERTLDLGVRRIGLSYSKAFKGDTRNYRHAFFEEAFGLLEDADVEVVHAFGLSTISDLIAFPFTSCDSTTSTRWRAGQYKVAVPCEGSDGRADYAEPPYLLNTHQYRSLLPDAKSWIDSWFEKIGVTPDLDDPGTRRVANHKYHQKLMEFLRQGHGREVCFYEATTTDPNFRRDLDRAGYPYRLLSYAELTKGNRDPDRTLREYTGGDSGRES